MERNDLSSEFCNLEISDWKERSLLNLSKFSAQKKQPMSKESSSELLKKKEIIKKQFTSQLDEIQKIKKELDNLGWDDNCIKEKCRLYELITNITWDLGSLPHSVKGYVNKPFKLFDLNTETQSRVEISNFLWDLISDE